MNLKTLLTCAAVLLSVLAAEAFSYFWMNPPRPDGPVMVPHLAPPVADGSFKSNQDEFEKAREGLMCSGGWIGSVGGDNKPRVHLSWVEWDQLGVANTLEAFRHLPEECMGSVGMVQEKVYPQREIGTGERRMVFDSSRFRSERGGQAMYVFKAVWVSGTGGMSQRGEFFGFDLGTINRSRGAIRMASTLHRFKPDHTRVMMAGVTGLPSEELAWRHFSREVLPQIRWNEVAPASESKK
jgi:hypothetical protein